MDLASVIVEMSATFSRMSLVDSSKLRHFFNLASSLTANRSRFTLLLCDLFLRPIVCSLQCCSTGIKWDNWQKLNSHVARWLCFPDVKWLSESPKDCSALAKLELMAYASPTSADFPAIRVQTVSVRSSFYPVCDILTEISCKQKRILDLLCVLSTIGVY